VLDERDVIRVEDSTGGGVPQAIGFAEGGVANEDARGGACRNFGVWGEDQRKRLATDLPKVGHIGDTASPKLVRSFPV